MPKVSIIMPVYNGAEYIKNAVLSVQTQTLTEIEIVIIDDGSTDETVGIVEQLRESDKRIRLLKQNHGGSGGARNFGLTSAKGEYISFLDADDRYYDPKALEMIWWACHKQNMNIGGGYRINVNYGTPTEDPMLRNFEAESPMGKTIKFREHQNDFHYHNFIFKREFLQEHQIFFPDYLRYQDPVFLLKAMIAAKEFLVIPVTIYEYQYGHQNFEDNAMKVGDTLKGIKENLILANKYNYGLLHKKLIERLNGLYYSYLLGNLDKDILKELLEIEEINSGSKYKTEILILNEIYGMSKKSFEVFKFNEMLKNIIHVRYKVGVLANYLLGQGIHTVVIYGLGYMGELLYEELENSGVKILAGIDQNIKDFQDLTVITVDDEIPQCDAVIVTPVHSKEMIERIREKKVESVLDFSELLQQAVKTMD